MKSYLIRSIDVDKYYASYLILWTFHQLKNIINLIIYIYIELS